MSCRRSLPKKAFICLNLVHPSRSRYNGISLYVKLYPHIHMKNLIRISLLSCASLYFTHTTLVFAADKRLPKIGFLKDQKLAVDAIGEHCSLNDSPSARKSFIFISNSDGSYMNLDGQDIKLQYVGDKKSYRAKGAIIRINIMTEKSSKSTFTISKEGLSRTIKARCWLND
jgi:hypothetical protein